MNKDIKKPTRTDIQIIEIDETQYWTPETKIKVDKILTVYLYDKSVVTNLAEITPSYELRPLYYNVTYRADQERNEAIEEEIDSNFHNEQIKYVHCNDIEKFTHADMSRMKNNKRFVGRRSRAYDRFIEELIEYYTCNHII